MDNTPNQEREGDLADELGKLGQNLKTMLQTAWESEERRKVQQEIEEGLAELGRVLQQASAEFDADQVGQEVKAEVTRIRQGLESGEIQGRVRTDLLKALREINEELNKFRDQWAAPEEGKDG
jgi:hypothetical protein